MDVPEHDDAVQPPVVSFENVLFRWSRGQDFALRVPRFELAGRQSTLLVGPSGGGKSTLLSLLCGIVVPQSGTVSVLGQDLADIRPMARDRFRAEHFGIVFQMFNLLPYGSVIDNVVLPLSFASGRRARATENGSIEDEARRLLDRLGIDVDDKAGASAAELSVGQQQRVAVARALIGRPEIIVADEPTSALDRDRQTAFLDLLFEEVAAAGATLLMVSHDETLANAFNRVLRLDEIATTGTKAAA